jgi:hypothetical protein
VFLPQNMLREARRQKGLRQGRVKDEVGSLHGR